MYHISNILSQIVRKTIMPHLTEILDQIAYFRFYAGKVVATLADGHYPGMVVQLMEIFSPPGYRSKLIVGAKAQRARTLVRRGSPR